MDFRPLLFLVTGLVWLLFSAILGVALFLGIMLGHPLPPFLRLVHVHGALVGGVAQLILGAVLALPRSSPTAGQTPSEAHPTLYVFINAGTLGMLVGSAVGESKMIGASGVFVVLALLANAGKALGHMSHGLPLALTAPLRLWFYGVAVLALFGGLAAGEAIPFRLLSSALLGEARVAHIHLSLLAFLTLTGVGTMHVLFPAILNTRLHSVRLAQLTFALLPAGIITLVAGFLLAHVGVQIAGGVAMLIASVLYATNVVQTWLAAGRPSNAAIDHLLIATLFLILATMGGVLVAVNHVTDPPTVPFGTLHLVAYTHLALVGFILQTVIGGLSYQLPTMLAMRRVKSNKKRAPYLLRLLTLMERWRPIQVGTLSLGTVLLALVAALIWQFPMTGLPAQVASYISAGLLLVGLAVFAAKVSVVVGTRPEE